MVSFTELKNAQTASLTALAKAWSGVSDAFDDASKSLTSKATEPLWGGSLDGHSIRAAQGRSAEIDEQIKAGATEADDLGGFIEDFAGTVRRLQNKLATLVSEAGHAGLDVSAAGVVSVPAATMEVLRDSGHLDLQATAIDSAGKFNARIERVLREATEADARFNRDLRVVAELDTPDDNSFNADGHHDVAVTADAERAADLLRGGADHRVSAAELARANELLARYGDDDVFATALMNDLGPDGVMRQAGRISSRLGPGSDGLVEEMYGGLGETLATATTDSNGHHVDAAWVAEFRQRGAETFTVGPSGVEVPGYTLISPAFTSGGYDPDFIAPVTAHMMALDGSVDWKADWNPAFAADGPPGVYRELDPIQQSPINAALIAVDNNPAAATELFSHGPGGEYAFETADGDRVEIDPLDYVLRTAREPGADAGIDANIAGDAIEAAATGVSSDTTITATTVLPPHSPEMVDITERVMRYATENPEDFVGDTSFKEGMMDNFGDITANYMGDFHDAKQSEGSNYIVLSDAESHLALGNYDPSAESKRADDWLKLIGHDEAASATVWNASEQLMSREITATSSIEGVDKGDFNEVVEMHGRVAGLVTAGELEGIRDDEFSAAENANAKLDAAKKGVSIAAGVGLSMTGVGVVGGAVAGEATNLILDKSTEWVQDSDDEIWEKIDAKQAEARDEVKKHIDTYLELHFRELITDAASDNMSATDINQAVTNYKERYYENIDLSPRR